MSFNSSFSSTITSWTATRNKLFCGHTELSPCVHLHQNRTQTSPWAVLRQWPAIPLTRRRRRTEALSCSASLTAAPPACCRRITMETRKRLNPTGSQSIGLRRSITPPFPKCTTDPQCFYPLLIKKWTLSTKGLSPPIKTFIVAILFLL